MRNARSTSVLLAVALVILGATVALGHGGDEGVESLVLEPASIGPGGSVLVVGTDLEPDTERTLQLTGEDITIALGTSAVSEAGRFSEEITVPSHVPAGVYQIQSIGDETLTVELQIVGAPEEVGVPAAASAPADGGPRERGALGLGLVLALAMIAGLVGLLLVVRAEQLGSIDA